MILSFRKEDPVEEVPSITLEPQRERHPIGVCEKDPSVLSGRTLTLHLPPATVSCYSSRITSYGHLDNTEKEVKVPPRSCDPFRWIKLESGNNSLDDSVTAHGLSPTLRSVLETCQGTSEES